MPRLKIRIPKSTKGYVSVKSIMELNPNLQIVKIRKKFRLKRLRR